MDFSRLSSALFGSIPRMILTIVLAIVVLVGAGFLFGVFGVPTVEGIDNRFGEVNQTTTIIDTDLVVANPNPIGVRLGGVSVSYGVTMNDIVMAVGSKEGVNVSAGNSTLSLRTRMLNERIPEWWVSHVGNGEQTDLSVNATVTSTLLGQSASIPPIERSIETDIASSFDSTETRPIEADQPVVTDPVLYLNETSGSWGEVTDAETPVEMTFTLYNPKPYPIPLGEIGYDVTMNDVAVGAGETSQEIAIPPGSTKTVTATTVIDNEKLDEWWVSHLQRNQVTELSIAFSARIDLSEVGGGSVEIPLDTVTHRFETDVFGSKDGPDSPASETTPTESSGDRTATATPSPTDDDGLPIGDETSTPTPDGSTSTSGSPTDTPTADEETATPTPTDDGIL